MRRSLRPAGALLRRSLNLLPWVLIGSAIASPALAATDIALDNLRMPILVGALALLVVALALWISGGNTARKVGLNHFSEGIGQYRPKLGRGGAD